MTRQKLVQMRYNFLLYSNCTNAHWAALVNEFLIASISDKAKAT